MLRFIIYITSTNYVIIIFLFIIYPLTTLYWICYTYSKKVDCSLYNKYIVFTPIELPMSLDWGFLVELASSGLWIAPTFVGL